MKLLLDTHTFLWLIIEDPRLTEKAKKSFLDTDNDIFLSIASIWEIAIKSSLGKLQMAEPLEKLIPREIKSNGIYLLQIQLKHVMILAGLPFHHLSKFHTIYFFQFRA